MSKWIRGIYNAAANFNLSGSLRAARGRTLDRDSKRMREVSEQSNKSDIASESNKSCGSSATSAGTSTSSTGTASSATSRSTATASSVIIGNDIIITDSSELCDTQCNKCHPTFCDHVERDYAEYTASINTQGQGDSSWIRVSNEPRDFKHTSDATRNDIEHITGIQPGVTV